MTKVLIKPMSVNFAWKGRRYKTKRYKQYEVELLYMLRPMKIPEGPLCVEYEFGLSFAGADWDNPIKPFQDILQTKYKFNDSRIMKAIVTKTIVKKGKEFVRFKILPFAS